MRNFNKDNNLTAMTYIRLSSHGALFRCPFQYKYRYCPLDKIRKLSVEERVAHLKNLSPQQINNLEAHYKKCVAESKKLQKEKSLNN